MKKRNSLSVPGLLASIVGSHAKLQLIFLQSSLLFYNKLAIIEHSCILGDTDVSQHNHSEQGAE